MNKTELVAAIADQAELSKKDSEKALKAFIDVVTVSRLWHFRSKQESSKRRKKSSDRKNHED